MNLTDLANHICQQTGMQDTDDVAAAKMFLQRRLEMIWNTQLWRSSLLEATMTINPDGTCTLGNTIWIPSRATLMLPPEFDSVLAVRADNHAMNVASLESYYRTDTDWLNMQGDPTEFQILRPACWEFESPQPIKFTGANGSVTISEDGVGSKSVPILAGGTAVDDIQRVSSVGSASPVALSSIPAAFDLALSISPAGATFLNNFPVANSTGYINNSTGNFIISGITNGRASYTNTSGYQLIWTGSVWVIGVWIEDNTFFNQLFSSSSDVESPDLATNWQWVDNNYVNSQTPFVYLSVNIIQAPVTAYAGALLIADCRATRQRIRLTTNPQLSVNLRVLGKGSCPVLGDYDTAPINNVEPCLMAFARADMLLRARQHGKAQIAMQEGTALLAQLARSEAFQTANNFRIIPDNGFGGDNLVSHPNSLHPL